MNSALLVEKKMRDLKLTDEQVFCSPSFSSYLRLLLRAQARQIRRVPPEIRIVSDDKEKFPAYICGKKMTINYGHSMIDHLAKTRVQKARLMIGLACHEFGHFRFTDSTGYQIAVNSLFFDNKWFPALPELEDSLEFNRHDFEQYRDDNPGRLGVMVEAWHSIMNILEDAYIEESLYRVLNGILLDGLNYLRYRQREDIPTYGSQLAAYKDGKLSMYHLVTNLLLTYAKFGTMKCDWSNKDERNSEAVRLMRLVQPYVDPMLTESATLRRVTGCNLIFLTFWPVIKSYIDSLPKDSPDKAGDVSSSMSGASARPDPGSAGHSSPVPVSKDEDTGASGSRKARSRTKSEMDESKETEGKPGAGSKAGEDDTESRDSESDDTGTDSSDSSGGSSEEKPDASAPEEDSTKEPGSEEDTESEEDPSSSSDTDSEEDEDGVSEPESRAKTSDAGEVSIREDEGFFSEEDCEESFDDSELMASLRRLETEARKEIAMDEVNDELISELADEASSLPYGEAHKGMAVRTQRVKNVSERAMEVFNGVYAPMKPTVDEMVRKVAPFLRKKKGDEYLGMSGFYSGSKFDATRLVLNDWRNFKNNACPIPDRKTAVSVLVDESGSMNGERIRMARLAAIALYMFCNELDIKCSVIGHTESFSSPYPLELQVYSDFESPDSLDKFRLLNITARENNRDGAAVYFAGNHLLKRSEATKIMFIISDGAPAAHNYSGRAAETDLANTVAELRRRGVIVFAAAIGSDKEAIRRIYGSGFLDITDLNSLPQQLLYWLRRYVK